MYNKFINKLIRDKRTRYEILIEDRRIVFIPLNNEMKKRIIFSIDQVLNFYFESRHSTKMYKISLKDIGKYFELENEVTEEMFLKIIKQFSDKDIEKMKSYSLRFLSKYLFAMIAVGAIGQGLVIKFGDSYQGVVLLALFAIGFDLIIGYRELKKFKTMKELVRRQP